MEKREYISGAILCQEGQPVQSLMLILEGTVKGTGPGGELLLKKGDAVGLNEVYANYHPMTYRAAEKVTVAWYPYQAGELMSLLKNQTDASGYFASSVFRQFQDLFNQYKKRKADSINLYRYFERTYQRYAQMCEQYRFSPRTLPGQEEIAPFAAEEDIENWRGGFYKGLYDLVSTANEPGRLGAEFYCGMILNISKSIGDIIAINKVMSEYSGQMLKIFMNESGMDLFELFTGAYFRFYRLAEQEKPDPGFIDETVKLLVGYGYESTDFFRRRLDEYQGHLSDMKRDQSAAGNEESAVREKTAELANSLGVILEYAGYPPEDAESFRRDIAAYKQTVNKSSTEDGDRKLRLGITKHFYRIYAAALYKSLDEQTIPTIIKMFFQFGYVDEELAGPENAVYLANIADHLPTDPTMRVYTLYEWLKAIYEGQKEPSRNEFDNDYSDYVHELRRNHKITQLEESDMLADKRQKVAYEMENLFPVVNKITYGRVSIFCPVFSEHNILKPLEKMLVSSDIVNRIFNQIREKDFGAFCRESVYSQPDKGIQKEMITTEILPDVILMPNIGNRGIMWQEIEGKRRGTPARFMCSLFQMENLANILIHLTGQFRWEMCRRIQGIRWNDVAERSLTSDYYDYLQSYKKNLDLSSDVKEKIKADLSKNKNNTKEMFVNDYMTWIMFESNGSPRLNKVSRLIFFTYCPFCQTIREKLRANPLYSEMCDKYDIRLKQKSRYYDNLYTKLRNGGQPVPEEIEVTRRFVLG